MSSEVLTVEGLCKSYRIYSKPQDRLWQALRRSSKFYQEFWALREVSFRLKHGEALAIVGRNGSGKSTLLQLICGTLTPTRGSIKRQGRVAALLELGSGFNPEFNGLENIYLNASLLGLSTGQLEERLDAILAFAEIGDFIDQPVKTYSSGMAMRLAFAVAAHVEPDLLVVDEALAVGDAAFTRRCYRHLQQLRERGTSLLFVSHSTESVLQFCDSVLMLHKGHPILYSHQPRQAMEVYELSYSSPQMAALAPEQLSAELEQWMNSRLQRSPSTPSEIVQLHGLRLPQLPADCTAYPSNGVEILAAALVNQQGQPINLWLIDDQPPWLCADIKVSCAGQYRVSFLVKTAAGQSLAGALFPHEHDVGLGFDVGLHRVTYKFGAGLAPGRYCFNVGIVSSLQPISYAHRIIDAGSFEVVALGAMQVQPTSSLVLCDSVSVDLISPEIV